MIPSLLPLTVAYFDTCRKKVREGPSFSICARGVLYISKVDAVEATVLTFGHHPW